MALEEVEWKTWLYIAVEGMDLIYSVCPVCNANDFLFHLMQYRGTSHGQNAHSN